MRKMWLLPILSLSLVAAACGDDSPTSASSTSAAQVRVAHLSPDAPAVDVWVDGAVVLSGVPFQAISSYLSVPAGSRRIQVTPAGRSTPVVIDATLDLAGGTPYTVAATGRLSAIAPLPLLDDRNPTASRAKVRFVHAAPDAPAVDIAVAGGPILFSNVAFRGSAGYAAVDPGTYDLEVRVAGTSTVALRVPGVSLSGGVNYTIFAAGLLGNGTLTALPAVDTF